MSDPDAKLHGWASIAKALLVDERTARRLSTRNIDPLPTRVGHLGVWAFVEAVRDWVHRQDMAYVKHIEIERSKRDARRAAKLSGARLSPALTGKRRNTREKQPHAR